MFLIQIRSGLSLIFFYLNTHPLASPRRPWPVIGQPPLWGGARRVAKSSACLLRCFESCFRRRRPFQPLWSLLAAAQLERRQCAGDAEQESTVEVDQFSRKLEALSWGMVDETPGPIVIKNMMSPCSIWHGLWAAAQERRCLCVPKRGN